MRIGAVQNDLLLQRHAFFSSRFRQANSLLRFRAQTPLDDAKRAEAARTLGAVARLLTSALENLDFRNDEALRERLRTRSHGPNL